MRGGKARAEKRSSARWRMRRGKPESDESSDGESGGPRRGCRRRRPTPPPARARTRCVRTNAHGSAVRAHRTLNLLSVVRLLSPRSSSPRRRRLPLALSPCPSRSRSPARLYLVAHADKHFLSSSRPAPRPPRRTTPSATRRLRLAFIHPPRHIRLPATLAPSAARQPCPRPCRLPGARATSRQSESLLPSRRRSSHPGRHPRSRSGARPRAHAVLPRRATGRACRASSSVVLAAPGVLESPRRDEVAAFLGLAESTESTQGGLGAPVDERATLSRTCTSTVSCRARH